MYVLTIRPIDWGPIEEYCYPELEDAEYHMSLLKDDDSVMCMTIRKEDYYE